MADQPQTIGRYRVLRELGGGGMGCVYLAEDPALKRRLAIKVVRPGAYRDDMLQRFQREAEISARLSHPNIIVVYDVGEEPQLGPFLAMEFIDGDSLSGMVKGRAVPTAELLRILIQTVTALEAAHGAGIVHRDVKPGNVMVGQDGRAKLMDFGIARSDDSVTLTETGAFVGTTAYTAPELVKGFDPTPASDGYALAVMALELFTGARPHQGTTMHALLYSIVEEPPTLPDALHPPWRPIFERAFAKEPSARHASMREFLTALVRTGPLDPAARSALLVLLGAPVEEPRADAGPTVLVRPDPGGSTLLDLIDAAGRPRADAGPTEMAPPRRRDPPRPPPVTPAPGQPRSRLAIATAAAVAGIAGIVGVGIWMLSDTGVPPSEPTARVTTPAPSPLEPAAPVAGQEPAAREPPPAAADTAAARTDPEVLARLARTHLRERGFPSLQVTATEDGTVSVRGMVDAGDRGAVERAVREVQGTNDVDASGVRERRTRAELAAAISDALRDAELAHVRVEVDEQGAVTLAGLANRDEEARARRLVDGVDDVGEVRTAFRPAPPKRRAVPTPVPAATPAWGEIRREGAERTD